MVPKGGQDNHLHIGVDLFDLADQFEAIHFRHDQISHHHIEIFFQKQLKGLGTVFRRP